MTKASIEPFKDLGPVQVVAEMRRLQREKGSTIPKGEPRPKTTETLEQTVVRLSDTFTGQNEAVGAAERSRRIEAAKNSAKQRRIGSLWSEANVPARQANRRIETESERGRAWLAALRRIEAKGPEAHIALIGTNGNGKTQLSVEILRAAVTREESALWTTATDFLMAVKACYRPNATEGEEDVIVSHVAPRWLVIDEFHRRKGSPWEDSLLFQVIDKRYNAGTAVIMIANQTREEFDASMDGSILSRMNETGGIILCDWPSFRE